MSICQEPWNLLWNLVASGMSKYLSCRSRGCLCFACIVVEKSGNSKTWFLVFLLRLRPCLGQRWRRLNAISGKNPAERLASDARSPNACSAKRRSLNCAEENRRSELRAAFAFKRRAAGARGPKQDLNKLANRNDLNDYTTDETLSQLEWLLPQLVPSHERQTSASDRGC